MEIGREWGGLEPGELSWYSLGVDQMNETRLLFLLEFVVYKVKILHVYYYYIRTGWLEYTTCTGLTAGPTTGGGRPPHRSPQD